MRLLLAAFLPVLAAGWPFCPDPVDHYYDAPTERDVDLNYLFGDWYEAINTKYGNTEKCVIHSFAANFANSSARDLEWWAFDYLKHFRRTVDGPAQFSIGRCDKSKEKSNSLLAVHDLLSLHIAPFWICKVGPVHKHYTGDKCEVYRTQYEYVVVSNWEQYPAMVIVRNLEVFKAHYEREVMQFLTNSSAPFPKMTWRDNENPLRPDYSSCPEYSKDEIDNTMHFIRRLLP